MTTGTWYHVAGVKENSDLGNVIKVYVNGIEAGRKIMGFGAFTGDGDRIDLLIGNTATHLSGGLPGPFDGKIDDVRLYDRALSPDEVAILAAVRDRAP